jgi:hypothetical protein
LNLKHLTDDELEHSLGRLVRTERETITAILYHLLEVNRRRLYSKHKCESLHQYACKHFGYSESEAGLRITAMYLLKELPQAATQIEEGSISLTNLAQAQVHFRKEAKENIPRTLEEKLELLSKLENCSKLEAKQVIADEAETLFRLGGIHVPLSRNEDMLFRPEARLKAKLKRLKEVTGLVSLEELIEQMADLGLKTWDPAEKAKRALIRKAKKETQRKSQKEMENKKPDTQAADRAEENFSIPEPKRRVEKTRSIKMEVRHQVQLRDDQACMNCGSRKNLQFDHIEDFAIWVSN